MSPKDSALLDRWFSGQDADAFNELVARYSSLVYATCLRILRNSDDAEDLTQECFIRLAQTDPKVRTSLSGWFHAAATSRALNRIRADKRRIAREQRYTETTSNPSESSWGDVKVFVDEAIDSLPDDLGEAVVLHYLHQRSYESIAAELGVSRQAVSQRAKHGVEEIRAELAKRGVTLAAAALSTILADNMVLAAPKHLVATLGKIAIAGIGRTAVSQAAASGATKQGGLSLMMKMAIGTGVLALVAALTTVLPVAPTEPAVVPPVVLPETSSPIVDADPQPGADPIPQARFLLAQTTDPSSTMGTPTGNIDSGPLPGWYEPDPRKFSLTRPKPAPGTGSFHFALTGAEAVGAIASLYRIGWEYWEVVPDDILRLDKVVPESRIVTYKNLAFGNYHIAFNGETSGGSWLFTLSESSPMYVDVMQLAPMFPTTLRVLDIEGNAIPNPDVYAYTSATFGRPFPFLLSPFPARGDESGIVRGVVGQDRGKAYVTAKGYAPSITRWVEGGDQNVEIVLTEGGTVKTRVIDAISGFGVPGTIVFVIGEYFRDSFGDWTDEDGYLTVTNIRPGQYRLFLNDRSLVMKNAPQLIRVREGETTTAGTIEAVWGAVIRGRVYDQETDAGIPGIRIEATSIGRLPQRDIVTDADGYYEVLNVSLGDYIITRIPTDAYGAGSGPNSKELKIGPDGPNRSADFRLWRGIPFTGRVVDKNGRGISGAIVVGLRDQSQVRPRAVAGRSGAFNLSGIRRPGKFSLLAYGPGYAREQFGPFDLTEEGLVGVTLQLAPGASVQGRIVDENENTVAPATVTATRTDIEFASSETTSFSRWNSLWNGRFFMPNLPAGTYTFTAQPSRGGAQSTVFDTLQLREGEIRHGVKMVYQISGLTIAGHVTDQGGAPVSLADIYFHSGIWRAGGYTSYRTRTDPDGKFAMSGLANTNYTIQVTHSEYSEQFVQGVPAGDQNVRIALQGRGAVSGRIQSARDRTPIERFELHHVNRPGATFDVSMLDKFTNFFDENGEFQLDDVQAGASTIFAKAEGYAVAKVDVTNVQPEQQQFGVTINLEAAPHLSGTIYNASGEPVSGALIYDTDRYINHYSAEQYSIARTDGDGRFETDAMRIGETNLVIMHADYAPTTVDVLLEPGMETRFEATLFGGSNVYGIISLDGVPVASANVSLNRDRSSIQRHYFATTKGDGQYRFDKVSAGDAWVSVQFPYRGGTRGLRTLIAVDNAGDIVLDFAFENHWSGIEGTIHAPGASFDTRTASVYATANDEYFYGSVAEDGTFSLHGLPWGDVKLNVHAQAFHPYTIDLQLIDGQIVTQDVILGN
ncbi:MAG: sigma-70 family RNA polymerase sigma factor [Candidatus Hydrogenedentes bacterium]|nr:sigma-70 family RNA polymerase sigma factor [Candidatus Hydrogenedentota bacterium]